MSALPADHLARAREFYREQLALSFRYSRQFSQPLGTVAEALVNSPEFETIMRDAAVGSFDCARRVGEMVVVQLDRVPLRRSSNTPSGSPETVGAWWRDLLNYERGCFLQLATTAEGPPTNRPRRGVSAVCMNFTWAVPEVVGRIQNSRTVSEDLRRPMTLLFARTADRRVCVVEVGADVEKVFRATNGLRTIEQIAATAGASLEETREVLQALAGIGAVTLAMSQQEMTRLIEAREKGARE